MTNCRRGAPRSVTAFLLANGGCISRDRGGGGGPGREATLADPYDPVNRRVEMRIKIQ